ncbi:hypothetical protein D3C86_1954850 [compost metagenome]
MARGLCVNLHDQPHRLIWLATILAAMERTPIYRFAFSGKGILPVDAASHDDGNVTGILVHARDDRWASII